MSARKTQPKKRTKATGKRAQRAQGGGRAKSAARKARPAPKPKAKPARKPAKAQGAAKKAAAKKAALAKQKQAAKAKLVREREQAQRAKEKERLQKERDREKALKAKEKEREQAQRAKEKERLQKEQEREKAQKAKEKEREQAQRAKEKERVQKERDREKALKAKEREKLKAQQAAEKARLKKEAEAQRAREKAEKEAERKRLIAEREAQKEAARRAKEEERARREAEREAYRKAKEAERERLRAEREAARRLREGKVARATRAAQKMDGLRMGTTRVYDPAAIPNQSGTTRHTGPSVPTVHRLVGVRHADSSPRNPLPTPAPVVEKRPTPAPAAPLPPVAEGVEERYRRILERLGTAPEALKREYEETLEMSWIHHDSALEGVVYTFQELRAAMDPSATATPDSSMQPVCEEIRRHRQAIAYVRDLGERKRVPLNVDVVKRLFVMLHPEEGDVKTVKYRKDIPQHRLYFHEYAAPDKIAYRVRQIMDWLNGPEAKKMKNPLRVGARVHYDLLRVFPFAQDSGKVARLLMNIVLLRGGYPPAIVHSTERQRYYEALKGQLPVIIQLVNESIMNALASIEKRLDDEARASAAAS
ncbi:MAG TPA: Fic family protein [Polyangiaceae bacterium]|nr:Fic family protein [Polyangiaceae bacterium]